MLDKQEELRKTYVQLLSERDELLVWNREMLTAIYTTSIGTIRMGVLRMQLKIKILKTQIKLVHDLLYVGRKPSFDRIDAKIALRLEELDNQFANQLNDVDRAYHTYLVPGAKEKAMELHKRFMAIAAIIHPDLFMEVSFEQRRLWDEVKEAYANGDMLRMKSLERICQSEPFKPLDKGTIDPEALDGHINRLQHHIDHVVLELKVLQESYPFTMEDKLLNAEWVKVQQQIAKEELEKLRIRYSELEHEYSTLKLTYGDT